MAKYLFVMAQEGHPWGGSEPLWANAAERLVRAGNEVRVSAREWDTPTPQLERLRALGCGIFYRQQYRLPSFFVRQFRRLFPPPPFLKSHMGTAGASVDLVVVCSPDNATGLEWMEAARAACLRYAVIAQSAVVYWWPEDDRAERLARAYEGASGAYFVSQAILETSRLQFGTGIEHAKVVRNPFNVRYDACPEWPRDAAGVLRLACVGRLDVISKGQDVLLQVLALPHWRERDVHLSFFGEGPHQRGLRRMAKRFRLDNVEFRGQSNDIEGVWSRHHALVLPSRFEGMPLVVVEAMLCGRPCVVTDVGGNRELIRDGVNGFVAEAATANLLDRALCRAWDARQDLRDIGERAWHDVRRFVSDDPAAELARELSSLAGGAAVEGELLATNTIGAPVGV